MPLDTDNELTFDVPINRVNQKEPEDLVFDVPLNAVIKGPDELTFNVPLASVSTPKVATRGGLFGGDQEQLMKYKPSGLTAYIDPAKKKIVEDNSVAKKEEGPIVSEVPSLGLYAFHDVPGHKQALEEHKEAYKQFQEKKKDPLEGFIPLADPEDLNSGVPGAVNFLSNTHVSKPFSYFERQGIVADIEEKLPIEKKALAGAFDRAGWEAIKQGFSPDDVLKAQGIIKRNKEGQIPKIEEVKPVSKREKDIVPVGFLEETGHQIARLGNIFKDIPNANQVRDSLKRMSNSDEYEKVEDPKLRKQMQLEDLHNVSTYTNFKNREEVERTFAAKIPEFLGGIVPPLVELAAANAVTMSLIGEGPTGWLPALAHGTARLFANTAFVVGLSPDEAANMAPPKFSYEQDKKGNYKLKIDDMGSSEWTKTYGRLAMSYGMTQLTAEGAGIAAKPFNKLLGKAVTAVAERTLPKPLLEGLAKRYEYGSGQFAQKALEHFYQSGTIAGTLQSGADDLGKTLLNIQGDDDSLMKRMGKFADRIDPRNGDILANILAMSVIPGFTKLGVLGRGHLVNRGMNIMEARASASGVIDSTRKILKGTVSPDDVDAISDKIYTTANRITQSNRKPKIKKVSNDIVENLEDLANKSKIDSGGRTIEQALKENADLAQLYNSYAYFTKDAKGKIDSDKVNDFMTRLLNIGEAPKEGSIPFSDLSKQPIAVKEVTDALQKQSTEAIPIREGTRGGERVRGTYTEGEEVAGTREISEKEIRQKEDEEVLGLIEKSPAIANLKTRIAAATEAGKAPLQKELDNTVSGVNDLYRKESDLIQRASKAANDAADYTELADRYEKSGDKVQAQRARSEAYRQGKAYDGFSIEAAKDKTELDGILEGKQLDTYKGIKVSLPAKVENADELITRAVNSSPEISNLNEKINKSIGPKRQSLADKVTETTSKITNKINDLVGKIDDVVTRASDAFDASRSFLELSNRLEATGDLEGANKALNNAEKYNRNYDKYAREANKLREQLNATQPKVVAIEVPLKEQLPLPPTGEAVEHASVSALSTDQQSEGYKEARATALESFRKMAADTVRKIAKITKDAVRKLIPLPSKIEIALTRDKMYLEDWKKVVADLTTKLDEATTEAEKAKYRDGIAFANWQVEVKEGQVSFHEQQLKFNEDRRRIVEEKKKQREEDDNKRAADEASNGRIGLAMKILKASPDVSKAIQDHFREEYKTLEEKQRSSVKAIKEKHREKVQNLRDLTDKMRSEAGTKTDAVKFAVDYIKNNVLATRKTVEGKEISISLEPYDRDRILTLLTKINDWSDLSEVLNQLDKAAEKTTRRVLVREIIKSIRRARNAEGSDKNITDVIIKYWDNNYYSERISKERLDWYKDNKDTDLTDLKDIKKRDDIARRLKNQEGKEYIGDLSVKDLEKLQHWIAETDEIARAAWKQTREDIESQVSAWSKMTRQSIDDKRTKQRNSKERRKEDVTKEFSWFGKRREEFKQFVDLAKLHAFYQTSNRIFLDFIDGGKNMYEGAVTKIFGYGLDENYIKYLRTKQNFIEGLEAIKNEQGLLTKDEDRSLHAWAIMQQKDGEEYLTRSGRYDLKSIEKLKEVGLNEKQQHYYNYIRKSFDELFPDAKFVAGKYFGDIVEFVQNYFPIKIELQAGDNTLGFHNVGLHKPGELLSRIGPNEQGLRLGAVGTFEHYLDKMSYFIHVAPYLQQLDALLKNEIFQKDIGNFNHVMLEDYVNRAKLNFSLPAEQHHTGQFALDTASRLIRGGYLLLSVKTLLVQPTSIVASVMMNGSKHTIRGIMAMHDDKAKAWLKEYFVDVYNRRYSGGRYSEESAKGKLERRAYRWIGEFDSWASWTSTFAAYSKFCELQGIKDVDFSKPPSKDAQNYVRDFINTTQGPSTEKERSRFVTGGKGQWFARNYMVFRSYSTAISSLAARKISLARHHPLDAVWTMMALTATGLMDQGIHWGYENILRGLLGKRIKAPRNDEEAFNDIGKDFLLSAAEATGAGFALPEILLDVYQYHVTPKGLIHPWLNIADRLWTEGGAALFSKHQATRDKNAIKAVLDAGIMTGLPVFNTLRGIYNISTED